MSHRICQFLTPIIADADFHVSPFERLCRVQILTTAAAPQRSTLLVADRPCAHPLFVHFALDTPQPRNGVSKRRGQERSIHPKLPGPVPHQEYNARPYPHPRQLLNLPTINAFRTWPSFQPWSMSVSLSSRILPR